LFKHVTIEILHCDTCELAKHHHAFFHPSVTRSSELFYFVHTDIWGPTPVHNISGATWFVTFINDCTRVTWVYLLKKKSDVSVVFPIFHNMINNQFRVKIKKIRSDNACDYFNHALSSYFHTKGIIHESSCVDTPQHNKVTKKWTLLLVPFSF